MYSTPNDIGSKQMMVINNAYEILKDMDSRELYDKRHLSGSRVHEVVMMHLQPPQV
jgi:DnaJ-class molecular chaperone